MVFIDCIQASVPSEVLSAESTHYCIPTRRLTCTVASEELSVNEQLLREELCSDACLVYSFSKTRVYVLPAENTELSKVLDCLTSQGTLATLGIQQWGLSQTTLEEVFIRIVTSHS